MVTKITAYQAEDGSVHPTELEAARVDAMCKLNTLDIFQHATRLAMVNNPHLVVEALRPLIALLPKDKQDA